MGVPGPGAASWLAGWLDGLMDGWMPGGGGARGGRALVPWTGSLRCWRLEAGWAPWGVVVVVVELGEEEPCAVPGAWLGPGATLGSGGGHPWLPGGCCCRVWHLLHTWQVIARTTTTTASDHSGGGDSTLTSSLACQ